MAIKEGSTEYKLLKFLGEYYKNTDLSNCFSPEEQASPLAQKRASIDDIVKGTGLPRMKVKAAINNIEKELELPKEFPYGCYPPDEARIRRIARHERLMRNNGNYKDDKIYLFCGQLGLGSTIGDPDIYKGLGLFIESQNYAPKIEAVILQGGLLPEQIGLWSKINQERAKQIAAGKSKHEDEEALSDEELYKKIEKEVIETYGEENIPKDKKALRKFIIHYQNYIRGTPNTLEALGKNCASWIAPTLKAIDSRTSIIYQYGSDDFFNMNQMIDLFLAEKERILKDMEKIKKIPDKERERINVLKDYAYYDTLKRVGEYVINRLSKVTKKENDELYNYIKENIFKGKQFKKEIRKIKKEYVKKLNSDLEFTETLEDAVLTFSTRVPKDIEDIKSIKERYDINAKKTYEKMSEIEEEIMELKLLDAKIKEEKRMGWLANFTKKKAITNRQAKEMHHIIKSRYREQFIKPVLTTYIKELIGKEFPNLRIFSSPEITLAEETMHGMKEYEKGRYIDPEVDPMAGTEFINLGGISIALVVNPDIAHSMIPKHGDARRMINKYNSCLSKEHASKNSKKSKYTRFHTADIFYTSFGAGGLEIQPQIAVGETVIENEYVKTPKIKMFIKGCPMHSPDNLADVSARWPSGTAHVKRFVKGGFQSGPLFYINKADGAPEFLFVDAKELINIGRKYYDTVEKIKGKLAEGNLSKEKKRELQEQLNSIYEKIKFKKQNVLLADDWHLGCSTLQGRPSAIDSIRTTLTNALDKGYPSHIKMTEMLHGNLKIGQMDTSLQSSKKTIEEQKSDLYYLEKALQNKDITKQEYELMKFFYYKEQENLDVRWRLSDQLSLYVKGPKQALEDMMFHGTRVIMAGGNHLPGEVSFLAKVHDPMFKESGLLITIENPGEGKTYSQVHLNDNVDADIYHKMWSGSTELSIAFLQAIRTRTKSKVIFTADRHHGGVNISDNKAIYLDFGHQPTNAYVSAIGKCSSLRGSIIAHIPKDGRNIYGGKFITDLVNNPVMAWDEEARILEKMHNLIEKYRRTESLKKIDKIRKAVEDINRNSK